MRIGIVAVHGVIPQVRYGFQDQVAGALCDALNGQSNGKHWTMSVVLPRIGAADVSDVPTISRVHVSRDNADDPEQDFFDVHEAYWSPIDKGKTTFPKVLTWLLTTVFLPFNDFARYRERPQKVLWDIGFIGLAIALGLCALVAAALVSAEAIRNAMCLVGNGSSPTGPLQARCPLIDAMHAYKGCLAAALSPVPQVRCPGFDAWHAYNHLFEAQAWRNAFDTLAATFGFVLSPMTFVRTLSAGVVIGLVAGVCGAYLWWQVIRALTFIVSNLAEFAKRDPVQLLSRAAWTTGLAVLAALFEFVAWNTQTPGGKLGGVGIILICAVGLLNFGRSYLAWFVTNFFGDVQIYTTRDQNSAFYALREQILEKVTGTIVNVATTAPSGDPYERVYVFAHSLGSSISMDAILRLYEMQAISSDKSPSSISPADWSRIRGFVTFGTALEKTKYFFSAWNPTPSQSWEQWNAAVYGTIFTAERNALEAPTGESGIYWLNNWFFSDFVSDQICTYRSFLLPGERVSENAAKMDELRGTGAFIGRLVAENRESFGPFLRYIQTHTHYLESPWFWHPQSSEDIAVIDVLTSGLVHLAPERPHVRAIVGSPAAKAPPAPKRAVRIPAWSARFHKSWEVVQ